MKTHTTINISRAVKERLDKSCKNRETLTRQIERLLDIEDRLKETGQTICYGDD